MANAFKLTLDQQDEINRRQREMAAAGALGAAGTYEPNPKATGTAANTAGNTAGNTGGAVPTGAAFGAAGSYQENNPYKAAVAAAGNTYTAYGTPAAGFKGGMSAQDQASWNAIGAKYAAGDQSWNKDTNGFRTSGNFSSYYDDNGNVNGWLYAANGVGNYAPVFGGKVGETGYAPGTVFYGPDGSAYTMDADGNLTLSGRVNWKQGTPGKSVVYDGTNFHGTFKSSNGNTYDFDTATDDELMNHGYMRDLFGNVTAAPEEAQRAYWAQQGLMDYVPTENQIQSIMDRHPPGTPANAGGNAGALPGTGNYSYTGTGGTQPTGNNGNSGGGYPGNTGAGDTGNTGSAGTAGSNPYQAYLDQWNYEPAPEWDGTDYERQRDEALATAQNMQYEGSDYADRRDEALAAAGEKWDGSEYQRLRDAAARRAEAMKWDYDPNKDPSWQAYQKQYRREGERAMKDLLGQYASMTGGNPSSYALTAASQAGDYYAAQLADKLPQLYQDAYQRYLQEFQKELGISDQYQGFDDREYSRWADQQGRNFDLADRYNQYDNNEYQRYLDRYGQQLDAADRYNQYGSKEYDRYLDQLGQYNTDRSFDYGRYRDAVGDARYEEEKAYDRAWSEDERKYSRWMDSVNLDFQERQWAQKLLEYADSQKWKAAEWNQYLREYGDQLSEKERQWAYQVARDAVSDSRYDQEYADQQAQNEWQRELYGQEYADEREDAEWERDYKQNAYNNALFEDALSQLDSRGIVTGIYAEILGVPDGTTLEDYYSRFGGGSQGSPFSDAEVANPGYTPREPQGPAAPPSTEPTELTLPELRSRYGNDVAMEVWSLAGRPWYAELKSMAGTNKTAALDRVYELYETGQISEAAIEPLLDLLGLNMSSVGYKPSYRVAEVKGKRNGGSKGNNFQDEGGIRG